MTKLLWDAVGERLYETGVKQGVLFPQDVSGNYPLGIAWNGLSAVTESPSGAEATPIYADDTKYLNLISAEEFGATVEAYTYPDEFAVCDGSADISDGVSVGQQARKAFGLAYRTTLGNDIEGEAFGYKLHLLYGALAAPSEKAFKTINDSPEAITFSWVVSTTPVAVNGLKPTASLTIDSTKVDPTTLATLEDILYGTSVADPRLPLPDEIATLFGSATPSAISLTTIVPADDATGIAIDANIVLTFNNAIQYEDVIVAKDDGTIVPVARSWNTTRKVLTLNPTSDLDNTEIYIVTVGGVVDIYGQRLADAVKNFQTVGA